MFVRSSVRRALAALLLLAIVGASCGDDGGDGATNTGDARSDTANDSVSEETGAADGSAQGTEATSTGTAGDDELCTAERGGGSITAGTWLAFDGLDPFNIQGSGPAGGELAEAFYGTLLHWDPATDTYEPEIAESVEPSEKRTVWTVQLRDDVVFGNGDQLTTEHVAAHFERMKEATVRGATMAAMVQDVEIVDDLEMVVTLTDPANFRYMVASDLGWIPNKDLVAQRGDGFHRDPTGAGAGAFELERLSATAGEELVFAGKNDYWGGEVCLEQLRFVHVQGEDTRLEAFNTGELDTMWTLSQRVADELDQQGDLAYGLPIGSAMIGVFDVGASGRERPFADVRVREALQLAVDYEVLSSRVWEDLSPRTNSALVPEESPLWVEGLEGPPHDPDRAGELVEQTISEGVWEGSFTFLYQAGDPEQEDLAVLLEGLWESVGMDVTLEARPSLAQPLIVDKNFDGVVWATTVNPPWPFGSLGGYACGDPRNRTGHCDPELDEALAGMREALTTEEVQEALIEVQKVFNRTFPSLVVRHSMWAVGAHENVHGLRVGADVVTSYAQAWVDQ